MLVRDVDAVVNSRAEEAHHDVQVVGKCGDASRRVDRGLKVLAPQLCSKQQGSPS